MQRQRSRSPSPSTTVMVRGLNPHTTEYSLQAALASYSPKAVRVVGSTLERRGAFAFVELPTVDHSRALVKSSGLVIDGVEVSLEYGRGRMSRTLGHADWVCDQCGSLNFARRIRCFGCGVEKPHQAVEKALPDLEGRFDSDEPTPCLVVYGLSRYSGEPELEDALRPYAALKDVKLLRDSAGQTRGVGFVTFFNTEAATHTLRTARVKVDGKPVSLAYTKGAALARVLASAACPPPEIRRRSPSSGEEHDERKDREWPPPFQADGAAYSFDPGSGYFYEPLSGFYFDVSLSSAHLNLRPSAQEQDLLQRSYSGLLLSYSDHRPPFYKVSLCCCCKNLNVCPGSTRPQRASHRATSSSSRSNRSSSLSRSASVDAIPPPRR